MENTIITREQKRHTSDERILLAAMDVFGEKGYATSTMNEIALKADVIPEFIMQRFGSKENLLSELFSYSYYFWEPHKSEHNEMPDILYDLLDSLKALYIQKPNIFHFYTMINHSPEIPEQIRQKRRESFEKSAYANAIRNAQNSGRLPKGSVNDLFSVFMSNSCNLIQCYVNQNIPFPENRYFLSAIQYKDDMQLEWEHRSKINQVFSMAASAAFAMAFYINLSKDTYYCVQKMMLRYFECSKEGSLEELHQSVIKHFYDKEKLEEYERLFSKEAMLQAYQDENRDYYYHYQIIDEKEEMRWVETHAMLFKNDEDDICAITLTRFIDEEVKRQQLLEKALLAAQIGNKVKDEFIFNMSHDIRTPMNAIMGYADMMMQKTELTSKQKKYIKNIKTSGKYLLEMMTNVLELQKCETEELQLDEEPIDLMEIPHSLYTIFKEEYETKKLNIQRDFRVENRPIFCDVAKVKQILLNVVSNAVKYTPEGGSIKLFIKESPAIREGYINYTLVVEDTGIGISEEFLPYIFDQFAREKNMTQSRIQGSGLGMALVKRLVDFLGGTVKVDSRLGTGTRVTINMEFRSVVDDIKNTFGDPLDYKFNGGRVLIAEDNELNAEIVSDFLESIGFEVDLAKDGIICVAKLEQAPPEYYDFIIMDIQMPNMDGYKATSIIRKLPEKSKANIPIIAMTANVLDADRKKALQVGMNGFTEKPLDIHKMQYEMHRILNV